MAKKLTNKFEFDTDYQELILRYTAQDRLGFQALDLYEDTFFTLLEHQIIAYVFKKHYKKYKRIPGDKGVMNEELRRLFSKDRKFEALTDDDRTNLTRLVARLYSVPVKDGEHVFTSMANFRAYSELKDVVENIDLKDFSAYENFASKVSKAIRIPDSVKPDSGINFLEDITKRQAQRQFTKNIVPTPFWQLNKWTNSGEGYNRGGVFVLIGPAKRFKTAVLINLAKGYLKYKKRILYIDLENGAENLAIRGEQSLANIDKRDILSGEQDEKIRKVVRKYRRLGGELHIKRMPAYTTSADSIRAYIKRRKELGETYNILIVDYAALMASISNKKDDVERISDVFLDLKNLAEEEFDACWTANHVIRDAMKRFPTKFEVNDIAKCIDIPRHVDGVFGLNRTKEEEEGGVMRMQVIEQRDGQQFGTAYFWLDIAKQNMREFHKSEINKYTDELQAPEMSDEQVNKRKKNADI